MHKYISVVFFLTMISVGAVEPDKYHRPLRLKDGSYLFINMDDTTDMLDKKGFPVKMKDGVEMELEDGSLIMMQNRKVWHQINNFNE